MTLEELKAQQEASKKPVAETPEWGGGMAQKRQAEERRQQMQAEAAKPFARSRCVKLMQFEDLTSDSIVMQKDGSQHSTCWKFREMAAVHANFLHPHSWLATLH